MTEFQPPEDLITPNRNILIVEDDHEAGDALQDFLASSNINSRVVGSVEEAIEAMENGEFSEIVTDGLNGDWLDVVESAREFGLPVTLLTANKRFQEPAEAMGVRSLSKQSRDFTTALIEGF